MLKQRGIYSEVGRIEKYSPKKAKDADVQLSILELSRSLKPFVKLATDIFEDGVHVSIIQMSIL